MAYLTVMHELHGELYMENRYGLFKFVPKPEHCSVNYEWLELGYCGEDRWLQNLRDVRFHPDTVSRAVDY